MEVNFLNMGRCPGRAYEVTEGLYFEAMDVVPPISYYMGIWAMGEPKGYTGAGEPIYYFFWRFNRKYYAMLGLLHQAEQHLTTQLSKQLQD